MNSYKNITGAFSDSAVLFPLLALLSTQSGASSALLLLSAGAAYCLSGVLFKIPMPVQPLKALAIAAVTLGATAAEVRVSGAWVGLFCLLVVFFKWDHLVNKVPLFLVHGLQVGLGVVMILKGVETAGLLSEFNIKGVLIYSALLCLILYCARYSSFPLLGMAAMGGLLWGLVSTPLDVVDVSISSTTQMVRPALVLTLVLPQLVLTYANSVVGTYHVAQSYFGEKAHKATPKNLLLSIGLGNLIVSAIGGLPFCHGAGGLTAHVKGGSDHWVSNWIIGLFLIILGATGWWFRSKFVFCLPTSVTGLLLMAVGALHMQLAKSSWQHKEVNYKPILVLMGITALLTQNMLWILAVGVFCFGFKHVTPKMIEVVARRRAPSNRSLHKSK